MYFFISKRLISPDFMSLWIFWVYFWWYFHFNKAYMWNICLLLKTLMFSPELKYMGEMAALGTPLAIKFYKNEVLYGKKVLYILYSDPLRENGLDSLDYSLHDKKSFLACLPSSSTKTRYCMVKKSCNFYIATLFMKMDKTYWT